MRRLFNLVSFSLGFWLTPGPKYWLAYFIGLGLYFAVMEVVRCYCDNRFENHLRDKFFLPRNRFDWTARRFRRGCNTINGWRWL